MAALLPVVLSDSFDQWRLKTNQLVDRVNNITVANDVFSLQDPLNDQDLLVYDAALGKFVNTTTVALVAEILVQLAAMQSSQLKTFFLTQQRNVF